MLFLKLLRNLLYFMVRYFLDLFNRGVISILARVILLTVLNGPHLGYVAALQEAYNTTNYASLQIQVVKLGVGVKSEFRYTFYKCVLPKGWQKNHPEG